MKKGDVTRWLEDEVTQDYFERVRALLRHSDEKVHGALSAGKLEEAANWNAGADQLKEVIDLPEQIKLEIEDEDGNT